MVMSWIRLPGLPSYFYRRKILKEIGGLIGRVAKLDLDTDNKVRGKFARLAVYVNLEKPLISHVFTTGKLKGLNMSFSLQYVFNAVGLVMLKIAVRLKPPRLP